MDGCMHAVQYSTVQYSTVECIHQGGNNKEKPNTTSRAVYSLVYSTHKLSSAEPAVAVVFTYHLVRPFVGVATGVGKATEGRRLQVVEEREAGHCHCSSRESRRRSSSVSDQPLEEKGPCDSWSATCRLYVIVMVMAMAMVNRRVFLCESG